MRILNMLTAGGIGGIEVLCRAIGKYSEDENIFCFLFDQGIIYEQMKEMGYSVEWFNNKKKISVSKMKRLYLLAKQCDVIVVHHDDPFLQMYYLGLKRILPRKKYISIVHHCYTPQWDKQYKNPIKRNMRVSLIQSMFDRSDQLVFVSKAGRDSYLPYFKIEFSKTSIVYNGIETSIIEQGAKQTKEVSVPINMVYVGRLVKLKGIDMLIKALSELKDRYEFRLIIVGDGTERLELEELVKTCGLQKKVSFVGYSLDPYKYYCSSVIFVYPSQTEIFGISIVEAMAFKNICVANAVGGIPELITDNQNGYLNSENTVEGLKMAIIHAIEATLNENTYKKLCENSQNTARKFSIINTIEGLEAVYRKVVK